MNTHGVKIYGFQKSGILFLILAQLVASVVIVLFALTAHAASVVTQVSTGSDSTCAVKDGKAYCWGSNASGKLGNNGEGSSQTKPVPVVTAAVVGDPGVCASRDWFNNCTSYSRQPVAAKPGSPLANRIVTKVSVGTTHACALADAKVYCWGDNTYGQLGNLSTTSSAIPVAVSLNETAKPAVPSVCTATFFVCVSWSTAIPAQPVSGLVNKEVVDISAGENFTCALASDGTVACWGSGANGRLGSNDTANVSVPKAVYKQSGSALFGKKGIKLAKVAGGTMCVFAINNGDNQSITNAKPYCWGYGVGDGTIPQNQYVKCGSGIGTSDTNLNTTTAVYFDALQPRDSSGVVGFVNNGDVASSEDITSLGNDQKAYYWGLHGYTLNKRIARTANNMPARTGTSCFKTVTTSNSGGNVNAHTGHACGGGGGSGSGSPGCGGGGGSTTVTTQYYDVTYTYTPVGSATVLGPLYNGSPSAGALNQKPISLASGNALDGLFCAKTGTALYCDAHGTEAAKTPDGRTGSNYVPQCTTTGSWIFTTTTCVDPPTGPQAVVMTGWLSGKTVTQISTSTSQNGYTCVLASGSVGCWGANDSGQLGTNDKNNRNVPTAVVSL
jgi:alpha-tubulin suppressor-like RCC1 family protein